MLTLDGGRHHHDDSQGRTGLDRRSPGPAGSGPGAAGMRRVVWFGLGPPDAPSPYLDALRGELRELGWSEGRNLTIGRLRLDARPRRLRGPRAGNCRRQAGGRGHAGIHRVRHAQDPDHAADCLRLQRRPRRRQARPELWAPGNELAISGWPSFAESGLLLNYGPNLRDLYRGLARYVSRILRGAKPEDLPVESPRTVELVVNLQTARALGVKIPESIVLRADRVIE